MSKILFRKILGTFLLLLVLSASPRSVPANSTTKGAKGERKFSKGEVHRNDINREKKDRTPDKIKKIAVKELWYLGPFPVYKPVLNKKFSIMSLMKKNMFPKENFSPPDGSFNWLDGKKRVWKKTAISELTSKNTDAIAYTAFYLKTDRFRKVELTISSAIPWRLYLNGEFKSQSTSCLNRKNRQERKNSTVTPIQPPSDFFKASYPILHYRGLQPFIALADLFDIIHSDFTENSKLEKSASSKEKYQNEKEKNIRPNGDEYYLKNQLKLLSQQIEMLNRQLAIVGLQLKRKSIKKLNNISPKNCTKNIKLSLTQGTHLLLLKGLFSSKFRKKRWNLNISVKPIQPKTTIGLDISLSPQRYFSIPFLLNRIKLKGASISPDGREVVLWYNQTDRTGKTVNWYEIRNFEGKILYSSKPSGRLDNFQWSPDGKYYSFLTWKKKGKVKFGSLWLVERRKFRVHCAARDIKGLSYHKWSPDGRTILLGITEKLKDTKVEKNGLKRLRGMPDRWPWFRYRTKLYILFIDGGGLIQLTDDRWSAEEPQFSPDGKKILFVRWRPNYKKRPFFFADIFELKLKELKLEAILKNLGWLRGVSYSPDGKKLLIVGGPSLFGKLGWSDKLAKETIPNEYDRQLYIYDLKKKEVSVLTKKFAPAISRAHWNQFDGNIYFTAVDRANFRLYRYIVKSGKFELIPTKAETVFAFSFAKKSPRAVVIGTGVNNPVWAYTLEITNLRQKTLSAPAQKELSKLHLARIEPWKVKLSNRELDGRIYYPPGFDPRKRYPLIVYYYGGTYPVIRTFDGRYPFHLWAAHGYIVYVIQPSGAIGFGQEHSARHVNEWGSIVADEIIKAVKKFLSQQSFVDPKKIGAIGASYGGFMTMYLQTKTKLFAAAISHAGISNLTSYWGAGFWGYLYSAVATADRYPWNHPKFYIQQSPLYSAHKITTPLLLLHGSADTNVPPAESIQIYTALKLLNRPVELILVKGENHWILSYKKRLLWTQTILAWFDRYLKGQPLWWNTLYPKE